ncbi:DUF3572 domain-containing protein [Magnetospirillum sp. SS-4]|uniref:DUF3572 domain-containing protein n=1 Tax=Magnetospirillum sp. SS-4 TaxID=2681465 RepID=UPI0013839549|nr:DUF3572 domain-containing protein [Magnetospirillum sp. SS-4]CAA7614793.1 conserved hypothetical protein [Magnetospirillum sp. SS-4]
MDPFKPYQPRPKVVIPKLTVEDAETIAIKAMAFIAADEDLMPRFINLTGCDSLDDVRGRLTERAFLGSVLDFVLGNEQTTIAFAQSLSMAPEVTMLARAKLP